MKQLFLKAKHWQLFILVFGIPMLFQMVLMQKMFSNLMVFDPENSEMPLPDPMFVFDYLKFFPLLILLILGVQMGWMWSVAVGLQKQISEEFRIKLVRFKIFFFMPIVYFVFLSYFITTGFEKVFLGLENEDPAPIFKMIGTIIPMHFLAMFCMFHTLYFCAKTIKTAQLQKKVSFSDFVGEFFLLWFYPIGVWIVQPEINKLVLEKENELV